jgi:hypothetical protein
MGRPYNSRASRKKMTSTARWHPLVSWAHHGRGNALFEPKFCAEGPRDAGAPLNAPMKGTFFSTAAFQMHTNFL